MFNSVFRIIYLNYVHSIVGDKMNRNDIRSDLANEVVDCLIKDHHYKHAIFNEGDVTVETFDILIEHQDINQKKGKYIEISFDDYLERGMIEEQLKKVLDTFLSQYQDPKILIVGLGNQYLTSDAIGPRTLRDVRVTHFMDDENRKDSKLYDVFALVPGVMVQTGMESCDIVRSIVKQENIDVVIAIDALCAKNYNKLCHVIQVNNVGINPGGGIGNHRKAINKELLGIDVIAIGVPTVIYASSLVQQAMQTTISYFGDQLNDKNKLKVGVRKHYVGTLSKEQKEFMLGHLGTLDDESMERLFHEVLTPIGGNYVLSDKQIDEQCEIMAKVISNSINELRY